MKYFLLLAALWSDFSWAQECETLWVYRPYKICKSYENGIDKSQKIKSEVTTSDWTGWVKGGQDQPALCQRVVEKFNKENKSEGKVAKLTDPDPINEIQHEEKVLGFDVLVLYNYECEFEVTRYAPKTAQSPACGTSESWLSHRGGYKYEIPGEVRCLSCDDYSDQIFEKQVSCLRGNVRKIINEDAVDLRSSDLQIVAERISDLFQVNEEIQPIANLQTLDEVKVLLDFLEQYGFTE